MTARKQTALVEVAPLQQALALAIEAGDIDRLRDVAALGTALQKGAQARGLGIESENQAAEVVLRAERAMGQALLAMRAEGTLASRGASPAQWTSRDATSVKTLADLGLGSGTSRNQVAVFQKLAEFPDETFEQMLTDIKNAAERLSRVKFISRPPKPNTYEADTTPEAPVEPGFARFRQGAYEMLGWEVAEDGTAGPTDNLFMRLAADELAQAATLIKALVNAYNAAREAR